MKFKLGKLPARLDAVKFKLRKYIDPTALPTPPLRFGHTEKVTAPWGMLANDQVGDCVWAGAAHATMVWHAAGHKKPAVFNDKAVLADYSAQTGYDPHNPVETDNGTDMEQMAAYWRKTGIRDARGERHKIDSYVALAPGDWDELMLAAYLFNAVGVGVMYPDAAEKQFDKGQPWDVVPSPVGGGHYVPLFGRNSKGNGLCVTWGRLHALTPAFYKKFNDESIAYISFDALDENLVSAEGFDLAELRRDLKAL